MQKNNKNGIKHFLAFMECMDKGMKSKVEVAKILTKQLEEIAEETGLKDIDFSVSTESLTRFLLLEMSVNFDTDELIPLLSFSGEKEDFGPLRRCVFISFVRNGSRRFFGAYLAAQKPRCASRFGRTCG